LRFEVLTAVKMSVLVFWVVTLCGLTASIFSPKGGSSMFLQNFAIYLRVHVALKPIRPTWEGSELLYYTYVAVIMFCDALFCWATTYFILCFGNMQWAFLHIYCFGDDKDVGYFHSSSETWI
jgi:hypothetical protein